MDFPKLTTTGSYRDMIREFKGYNHNYVIEDGEFFDTQNLSSRFYPALSVRQKRGRISTLTAPQGMIAKDALAYVDGQDLYYNGLKVTGITLSTAAEDCPKQLVSMGAYLVVFPDGVYLNTKDITEYGALANTYTTASGAHEGVAVQLTMCRIDGSAYQDVIESSTQPESGTEGAYWLDTAGDVPVLKQYSTSADAWYAIATVYCKISASGINSGFSLGDGVSITADKDGGGVFSLQEPAYGGSYVIQESGEDYIVVIGIMSACQIIYSTQDPLSIQVKRKVPVMNYVIESGNRLWGCFYGISNGESLNEIYASKLGDPKNWYCYAGTASDSYAVSLGSDGVFTGAIAYQGYPVFFKENCIHTVYGDYPSNYQVQTNNCRGVQNGSGKSLAIVDGVLYYKSSSDVCVYDGSLPVGISGKLGEVAYSCAVSGAMGSKYYISMKNATGIYSLFVYDAAKGMWYREDNTQAIAFATIGSDLYFINADNELICINGSSGTREGDITWYAETGCIGYDHPDHKSLSKIKLRLIMDAGSAVMVSMQYDSIGEWENQIYIEGGIIPQSIHIPVIPHRCDHCRLRIEGRGDCKLLSITKTTEYGGDAV